MTIQLSSGQVAHSHANNLESKQRATTKLYIQENELTIEKTKDSEIGHVPIKGKVVPTEAFLEKIPFYTNSPHFECDEKDPCQYKGSRIKRFLHTFFHFD